MGRKRALALSKFRRLVGASTTLSEELPYPVASPAQGCILDFVALLPASEGISGQATVPELLCKSVEELEARSGIGRVAQEDLLMPYVPFVKGTVHKCSTPHQAALSLPGS